MKVYKMGNNGEWVKFSDGTWRYYPPTKPKPKQVKPVIKINK